MTKKEFKANLAYLKENDFNLVEVGSVRDNTPFSAEIENYTNAGGDMIIDFEVVDKEHLQEYINKFDINHEVSIWWPNGQKGNGVPFSNMKEHYEDLEEWLEELQRVCDNMPY